MTALFVSRVVSKEEEGAEDDVDKDADREAGAGALPAFVIASQVEFVNSRYASLALIKKSSVLAADKPLQNQLNLISFPAGKRCYFCSTLQSSSF